VEYADRNQAGNDSRLVRLWEETLTGEGVELTLSGLVRALDNEDSHIRMGAALLLGRRGEQAALPKLKSLLNDPSPSVCTEAAAALALLGDGSGGPVLVDMLKADLLTGAPLTAARYLASRGDPQGFEVVVRALKSELAGIRLLGAVALKEFIPYHAKKEDGHGLDLFSFIKGSLGDPDPTVRTELLFKAASLDDPRVHDLLVAVAGSDPEEDVRRTAAQLYSEVQKRDGGSRP
jgi:HEAT repeat protein